MKTLQMFLGMGMIFALLGLSTAVADIRNESARTPLTFSLDVGDSSVSMPDISFDTMGGVGGEEARSTCAMTSGGAMPNLSFDIPALPTPPAAERETIAPQVALAPLNSLREPPTYPSSGRGYPPPIGREYTPPAPKNPEGEEEEPPPPQPAVPEPATLLFVGLGIGTALAATRRRRNVG